MSTEGIMYACSLILTVGNVILMCITFAGKAKAPVKLQNERLDVIEDRLDKVERHLDADNKRIKSIEEGNKVTQKALLALMRHALNDQDNDKLLAAKDELENYLIDR